MVRDLLMTQCGFDELTANSLIAKLPADKLQQILAIVEKYGPVARDALKAAIPQLLVGDWFGASMVILQYLATHVLTLQAKMESLTPKDVTEQATVSEPEPAKEEAGKKPRK